MDSERSTPSRVHRDIYHKVVVPVSYYDLFQCYKKFYEEHQKFLASYDALGVHAASLENRMKNAIESSTKYGLAYMKMYDIHRRISPVEPDDPLISPVEPDDPLISPVDPSGSLLSPDDTTPVS